MISWTCSGVSTDLFNESLCSLSPFRRISGEEEPWTMDDVENPVQEWMPKLLFVFENPGYFSILLELASTVGTSGLLKVVHLLLVQFRQNLVHSRGSCIMSGNQAQVLLSANSSGRVRRSQPSMELNPGFS